MRKISFKRNGLILKSVIVTIILLGTTACSSDLDIVQEEEQSMDAEEETTSDNEEQEQEENTTDSENDSSADCTNENTVFNEEEGFLKVEFENAAFSGDWELRTDGDTFSGDGYMVWTGDQYLNSPGNATVTFKLNISNPGTYRFLWNSAVKNGNSGSEHNDSWLRFNDAADFYGLQGTDSYVYPKDTGKTPNPDGSSKDGWFKVYRSGSDVDFKWMSRTSDNDAHNIYVKFDSPGTYLMEVSPRSSSHGIDQFILFKDTVAENEATSGDADFSKTTCN